MKSLTEFINESKTKIIDIKSYGTSWIHEWGPEYCGNVLSALIEGVKEGMEKYPSDDQKFQDRCMEFLDSTLKDINSKIH